MSFSVRKLNIWIDDVPSKVSLGYTIMQGCIALGLDIPKFCYHDKLLIAGNCRICLVELLGSKKLVASCAVQLLDNSAVFTNTIRVRLARQNVLEFLLANHPLDCPICDQGGECDLQDITAAFGADRGRFYEYEKRSVLDKYFGPLIRTSMNRCIHCTRCVRFMAQTVGFTVLGTIGRGYTTEISNFVGKFLYDELSGNIIDVCPVGALTSKPYSFKVRPWELLSVEGIDALDSLNSNLFFDIAGNEICRVLPYANEFINEEWITNKARYSYDGLTAQRLDSCMLKLSLVAYNTSYTLGIDAIKISDCNGYSFFSRLPWKSAAYIFFLKLFDTSVVSFSAHLGALLDLESVYSTSLYLNFLGSSNISCGEAYELLVSNSDFSQLFLFNTNLLLLSKVPTFCVLIATNPRLELPLLNLRLGRLLTDNRVPFFSIGGSLNHSTFPVTNISNRLDTIFQICEYRHPFCVNFYTKKAVVYPLFLIGSFVLDNLIMRGLVSVLLSFCTRLFYVIPPILKFLSLSRGVMQDASIFDYVATLTLYSSRIIFSDLIGSKANSFYAATSTVKPSLVGGVIRSALIYSLGASGVIFEQFVSSATSSWFVHQGSHGSRLSSLADLILPTFTHVEHDTVYTNVFGLTQLSIAATRCNLIDVRSNSDIFSFNLRLALGIFVINFFGLNFFKYLLTYNYRMRALERSNFFLCRAYFGGYLPPTLIARGYISFSSLAFLITNYRVFFFFSNNFLQKRLLNVGLANSLFIVRSLFVRLLFVYNSFSTQPVLNYYGDDTNAVVSSSKVMSLSSTQLLQSNFSFTTYYV